MRTLFRLSLFCALISAPLLANQRASGWCELGAKTVLTGAQQSVTNVQVSYPACVVYVYVSGTGTLATLYSDNGGTPLSNPFRASSNGFWSFYAANGRYDIQTQGGTFTGGSGSASGGGPLNTVIMGQGANVNSIYVALPNCVGTGFALQYSFSSQQWGCVFISGGSGGGNVSTSGSPAQYQIPVWVNSNSITGISPSSTSGVPLISQGSSSYPVFGAINLAGGSSIVTGLLPAGNVATLNQNTTGTASNITGIAAPANGGTGIANSSTLTLGSSSQNWGSLATGIVKNTTITGALSVAASSDIISLWTGSCSNTTFLRGDGACSGGLGSVSSVSSGNLAPLFTTSIATPTTTPAISYTLSNAAQNTVLAGPASGGAGAPTYQAAPTIALTNMTGLPPSLSNVTNDTQTKAAVVPNTTPSSSQILVGNTGGTAYSPVFMSGDVSMLFTGVTSLATVNTGPGTCGDGTHVCQITTNGKGLVTAQSAVSITGGGGGGGVTLAPYTASVSAQTSLTVNQATHLQGVSAIAQCFDNSSVPFVVSCAYTRDSSGNIVFYWSPAFTGTIQIGSGSGIIASLTDNGTKFTTNSGCSETTLVGGSITGKMTAGTSSTCTVIITLGGLTAPNDWYCTMQDVTHPADVFGVSAISSTTVSFTGTPTSSDILTFGCTRAY